MRKPKQEVNGGPVLGRHFRAYHDERAGRRAPCASDGPLIVERHRTPARTTVGSDEYLILVALGSACGRLAVGTGNTDDAVSCRCLRSARRSSRTFRSLRSGRAWWTGRSGRTRITFFARRPDRATLPSSHARPRPKNPCLVSSTPNDELYSRNGRACRARNAGCQKLTVRQPYCGTVGTCQTS
jgi:hypothetical protein